MIRDIQTIPDSAESLDGPRGTAYQGIVIIPPGVGTASTTLPDGRVVSVVVHSAEEAATLVANMPGARTTASALKLAGREKTHG